MILKSKSRVETGAMGLQIAPLIDIVFLLLIYFMVTASLIRKEGDIAFVLPAAVSQQEAVTVPVEVRIEIDGDGTVVLEGLRFPASDQRLDELVRQILSLKQVALTQQSPFFVTLLPDKSTLHERVISVMDACAAAGVDSLTFSKGM